MIPRWRNILLLRFFFGLSTGALFVVSEAWILSAATAENRGRVMGIYTSLLSVTFAIGPLILPWTGIDGFLPWGIGIVCVLLAILPLAFVKVSDEQFKLQEGGGGFFGESGGKCLATGPRPPLFACRCVPGAGLAGEVLTVFSKMKKVEPLD